MGRRRLRRRDWILRLVGIPLLGWLFPNAAGLFEGIEPSRAMYWLGAAWFVLVSGAVWYSTAAFYMAFARRLDWLSGRVRKVAALALVIVLGTVPIASSMLLLWQRVAFGEIHGARLAAGVLGTVLASVFVVTLYEVIYLVKTHAHDAATLERLERAKMQAELAALEDQLDPHFLFNSLGALGQLIEDDPAGARAYTEKLARVYRYILSTRERRLVQLSEELAFLGDYRDLLAIRFGDALDVRVALEGVDADALLLPPMALQLLVENAVKHNEVSRAHPLRVEIAFAAGEIVVSNTRRPRAEPAAGTGTGLANLAERYRLMAGREIAVDPEAEIFRVRMPVVTV